MRPLTVTPSHPLIGFDKENFLGEKLLGASVRFGCYALIQNHTHATVSRWNLSSPRQPHPL